MDTAIIDILSKAATAVTQEPVSFEIILVPQSRWEAWLMKKGWKATKKNFKITPIVFGNLLRISNLLLTIDPQKRKDGQGFLDISYKLIAAHADTLVEILAIAIQNTKQDPSPQLMTLLRHNLTPKEMITLLGMILEKMDLKNFIISISSIRGLNVLESEEKTKPENEVSPSTQGS